MLRRKKQKERITALLTCNMSGTEKRRLVIVGKYKNPQCFRGIKNLPVDYIANKNAWMTGAFFTDFLKHWDQELIQKKKTIALVLDKCTAHPALVELRNIQLIFLPPNTTSVIQPLDQGIIKTLKALYRRDVQRKIVASIDEGEGSASELVKKISLLDAIHMLAHAWNSVTATTIVNCFRKAGFVCGKTHEEPEAEMNSEEIAPPNGMTHQAFQEWVDVDDSLAVTSEVTDDDIVEEIRQRVNPEEDSSNAINQPAPTSRETRAALTVLRRTLEHRGGTGDDYRLFYSLENKIEALINATRTQTTLEDYFR